MEEEAVFKIQENIMEVLKTYQGGNKKWVCGDTQGFMHQNTLITKMKYLPKLNPLGYSQKNEVKSIQVPASVFCSAEDILSFKLIC